MYCFVVVKSPRRRRESNLVAFAFKHIAVYLKSPHRRRETYRYVTKLVSGGTNKLLQVVFEHDAHGGQAAPARRYYVILGGGRGPSLAGEGNGCYPPSVKNLLSYMGPF